MHFVLPPLQIIEKAIQPAEFPLRHAVHDERQLPRVQFAETAHRPADRNPSPARAVPAIRVRRPACSTARRPLRGAIFFGSGTTRSMSMPITLPKPSHSGHAPKGLLKLNSRGSERRIFQIAIFAGQLRAEADATPAGKRGEGTGESGEFSPRVPAGIVGRRIILLFDEHETSSRSFGEGGFQRIAQSRVARTSRRKADRR